MWMYTVHMQHCHHRIAHRSENSTRSVITHTHTHTHTHTVNLSHPVCQSWGWISISAAAQNIPYTLLSDSHITHCRKSCSSFINIRPRSQKSPPRPAEKIRQCAGGRIFIIAGEEKVGSGDTAGCLFQPDNVVFVYCWGLQPAGFPSIATGQE